MNVIQHDVFNQNQSWCIEHIVDTGTDFNSIKVRARIRRNAHDFQSHAIAERWDGSQWQQVVSRPMTPALESHALSYTSKNAEQADRILTRDAGKLVIMALKVLR